MKNILVMIVASLLIISSLAVGISVMPSDTKDNQLNCSCDVEVYKFLDSDEDGIWDMSEPALEDWTIELYKYCGGWQYVTSGDTDSNGEVVFSDLDCSGHYKVRELIPQGWNCTTHEMEDEGTYAEESFWACQDAYIYFGNVQSLYEETGEIQACKYYDHNMNGERDDGEEGIGGWMIELWQEGQEIDEKMTPYDYCGCVIFYDLAPGNYTIREIMQDGWINTTSIQYEVEVVAGETTFAPQFGNIETGEIKVCKFNDTNTNGTEEMGEDRLSGWEFELSGMGTMELGVTGPDGCYIFDDLLPGNYTITETGQEGWFNTTPTTKVVEVGMGESKTVTFGNAEYSEIRILKFNDINMDGEYDEENEELVEEGVFFGGSSEYGVFGGETVGGVLSFPNMLPGTYTITEDLPEGWLNTTSTEETFDLAPGEIKILEFGNVQYGHLRVCKYYDADYDGKYDDGEQMLEDWQFNLWNTTEGTYDTVIDENVTGPCGCTMFWNLEPGRYAVQEILPPCWMNTTSLIQYVDITAGNTSELWFGNYELGNLTVYKFYDANYNGEYDNEDYMLENWTVYLKDESGAVLDTQQTDENGEYTFECLEPGTYYVQEELPCGWTNSTSQIQEVTVTDGGEAEVWFGNYELGDLEVYKYKDLNMNGTYDEGEEMLSDWNFTLYDILDNSLGYSLTNEEGMAEFNGLEPGWYYVEEELPYCWHNTTPLTQWVEVEDGETSELWFGNIQHGSIRACKYEDMNGNGMRDDEEPWLEDWTFNLWTTYENGTPKEVIETQVTDECGCVLFDELIPGTYVVEEMRKMGWCNTTSYLQSITIEPCQVGELYFGNGRVGEISGMKYKDIEADGEFDVGLDEPLKDWTINLWTADEFGNPIEKVKTTTTDRCGMYYFNNVCPGNYVVQEEVPPEWYNVTPALVPVFVESGAVIEDIDFANCMYKYIYGIKYYDWGMDGGYDEGTDEVLDGWEIQLWNEDKTEMLDFTYTEECGYYWFEELEVGTYWVKEVVPEGWHNSTPSEYMFEITCCNGCKVFNFGNFELVDIEILKFNDLNMDGVYDEGTEPLVDDVFFSGNEGAFSGSTVGGMLTFNNMMPGHYTVTETLPDGWFNTTAMEHEFDLGPGESITLEFGNVQYGNITVYKYYDANYNEIYDNDDYMLEDWTIELLDENMTVIDTQLTDANGEYTFEELEPGTYYVREVLPDCWQNSTPMIYEIEVTAGDNSEAWFGNYELGNIKIYKFNDTNLNGSYDDEEEMLEDWTFELYNENDELVDTNTTNEDGYTMFHCLEPGEYYVEEIEKPDWCNTTEIKQYVVVTDGQTSDLWFGNAECGTVYGYKFFDFNMNGIYDGEDEPLENWTIKLAPVYTAYTLRTNNAVMYRETTTDENGYYEFEHVCPGDYVVWEVLPPEWVNVTQYEYFFTMECGEDMQFDFGNYRPSDIWGMKYCDVDRDGEFDTGLDKPLEGWEINLWNENQTEIIDTTYTDNCGLYYFHDLDPGYYWVEEVMEPCGWYNVTPSLVNVRVGYEDVRVDFANWRHGEITVFKYYDENMNGVYDDGTDWPLVDWQINLWSVHENGSLDEVIDTGYTCEEGYYIFPDLEPGHYAVEDVIPCGWSSTTDPIQYVTVRCCCVWVEFGNYEEENNLELQSDNTSLISIDYNIGQNEVLCTPMNKIN